MIRDPILHVVVLALENHSFDQMLGCMKAVYPTLEGIDPDNVRTNRDDTGAKFSQAPLTERQIRVTENYRIFRRDGPAGGHCKRG